MWAQVSNSMSAEASRVYYAGSQTPTPASAKYTLQEYSNDVVYTLQRTCDEEEVPCPTIVSESGRAIAAYHSFLAFRVIGKKNSKDGLEVVAEEDDPVQIEDMRQALENMDLENYAEFYHDALHYREELFNAFNLGNIGLEERSKGDLLFWKVCQKAASFAEADENDSEEFESLKKLLSKKYIGNFSLFQSVPDMWGVQQIFPTMPLHRLDEEPLVKGTIADITCDSDGEIRSFAGENSDFLALHDLRGTRTTSSAPSSWGLTRTPWGTSTTSSAASTRSTSPSRRGAGGYRRWWKGTPARSSCGSSTTSRRSSWARSPPGAAAMRPKV